MRKLRELITNFLGSVKRIGAGIGRVSARKVSAGFGIVFSHVAAGCARAKSTVKSSIRYFSDLRLTVKSANMVSSILRLWLVVLYW